MSKKIFASALLAFLLTGSAAHAHVTVQPNEAPTASFFRLDVRVPNERDDAATTKVRVEFPENLISVSFQPKEGWTRRVTMKKLDEPIEAFGAQIDEVVGSVTWSGGSIAPHEFDEFGFSARTPEEAGTLEFKAFQTYDSGDVVEWTGAEDADEPAARVRTIDLGAEEGQGQLALLADVNESVSGMSHEAMSPAGDEEGTDLGVILGGAGAVLGALALALVLVRTRART